MEGFDLSGLEPLWMILARATWLTGTELLARS